MRAVSHLPVKLFLACLLAVAMLATVTPLPLFAQTAPSVTIAPGRTGDTAVRYVGSELAARLKVTGEAPVGSRVTAAQLVALAADGTPVGDAQVIGPDNRNNPTHAAEDDYLFVGTDGTIQGALSLLCANFGSRQSGCSADPATAVRNVRLDMTLTLATQDTVAAQSNTYRVDYDRPYVRRYELIGSNKIRAVFSEPVRSSASELVQRNGWKIDGVPSVVEIAAPAGDDCEYAAGEDMTAGASGCTRILTLSQALDQDATPRVTFEPATLVDAYKDGASNAMLFGTELNSANKADSDAADLVRPVAPHIESVGGNTGSGTRIVGNVAAPEARINNVSPGHRVEVTVQRPSGATDKVTATVHTEATSVDVAIPTGGDGPYALTAVAIDPSGNRSDDLSKSAPALASEGERPFVSYVLDTLAPQVLTAELRNRRTVEVRFTEPVQPADDAGNWFVGDVPVTAAGSGDSRTLTAAIDLTNPGAVKWQPTSAQPGSEGRYGDQARNGMAAVLGLPLEDLPPVQAPSVRSPARVVYTKSSAFRITGTGPARAGLAVDLFEQGGAKALRSAPLTDGLWSLEQALGSDGRFSYVVALRDTQTGATSPRIPVPDIVRDTVAPKVNVSAPAEPSTPDILGSPQGYGVGDVVTIRWTATDTANAPKRPDHGRSAPVFIVDETSGARRAVKTGIQHQAGQEQTANYTLKLADLAGRGVRDLHFDVAVTDLATNTGRSSSGTIRLLDTLIGYRAVLTGLTVGNSSVIEARFPTELVGTTSAADWRVNGRAPLAAQKSANGRVVTLTVPVSNDPNATHSVAYVPNPLNPAPLEDADERQVSGAARDTVDRIVPTLSTKAPATRKVVDRRAVTFSGTTDETGAANTVAAFRADRRGGRVGPAIVTTRASNDGSWKMSVPLDPNRRNRIVVQAVDPSGNRSEVSSLYSVIEDSKSPVVRLLSPKAGATIPSVKTVRWSTTEANKRAVAIQYKKRNTTSWHTVVRKTADDGAYRWVPSKRRLKGAIFTLRVRATDMTGKTDMAKVGGLRVDFRR